MKNRYLKVLSDKNFIFAKFLKYDSSEAANAWMYIRTKSYLLFCINFYIDLFGLSKDWISFLKWRDATYGVIKLPNLVKKLSLSFKKISTFENTKLLELGFTKSEIDYIYSHKI